MAHVTVLGTGGHARAVADAIEAGRYDEGATWVSAHLVDWDDDVVPYNGIALGTVLNDKRHELIEKHGVDRFVAVIHPTAIIAPSAKIGRAAQIMAGVIIGPHAVIGDFCVINNGAQVDHDCQIEDFSVISPGAVLAGYVTIRTHAFIGANATVIPKAIVGARTIVGAGAVVIGDIPDDLTVVGNPARKLYRKDDAE